MRQIGGVLDLLVDCMLRKSWISVKVLSSNTVSLFKEVQLLYKIVFLYGAMLNGYSVFDSLLGNGRATISCHFLT